ncbi:sacsin N-terminal ATP-binding-like domain-containing protein [Streptomyces niveus]
MSYTSAREYAGRSLFELLQNGYDAHLRDRRDGRVHVLLDEAEGEWGTLYVANGGTPFTWQNVKRICELAQSSKEVGEGIGNKGVGFRSILLISDAPEIYSADPDSPLGPEMDGYCFRFAQKADVEEFLADEDNAHEVAATYPRSTKNGPGPTTPCPGAPAPKSGKSPTTPRKSTTTSATGASSSTPTPTPRTPIAPSRSGPISTPARASTSTARTTCGRSRTPSTPPHAP